MNERKFTLADVLTLISALAFGTICFFGFNYVTLGDTQNSILLAVIITLLLIGFALGAKFLKNTSRKFKAALIGEIICLMLFAIIFIASSLTAFSHFFVVQQQKDSIKEKLMNSIEQAEKMYDAYEKYTEKRESLYKLQLKSIVNSRNVNRENFKNVGFEENGISLKKQIEKKVSDLHNYLYPPAIDEKKEKYPEWLKESQKVVEQWNIIKIVDVVKEVEGKSKNWLSELVDNSTKTAPGENAESFDYPLTFEEVKSDFETPRTPTFLSIILALTAGFMMIFTYLITKRHTKFPGWDMLFGKREKAENEL